jgi:hypothetical protein
MLWKNLMSVLSYGVSSLSSVAYLNPSVLAFLISLWVHTFFIALNIAFQLPLGTASYQTAFFLFWKGRLSIYDIKQWWHSSATIEGSVLLAFPLIR